MGIAQSLGTPFKNTWDFLVAQGYGKPETRRLPAAAGHRRWQRLPMTPPQGPGARRLRVPGVRPGQRLVADRGKVALKSPKPRLRSSRRGERSTKSESNNKLNNCLRRAYSK